MSTFQIGDRVEVDGESGVVVGVDHLTGRVTVRWIFDPDSSSMLDPGRVRLVERARDKVIIVTETPRVRPADKDVSLEEYITMGAPALVDLYPGASDEEMCRHEDRLLPYLLLRDDGVLLERYPTLTGAFAWAANWKNREDFGDITIAGPDVIPLTICDSDEDNQWEIRVAETGVLLATGRLCGGDPPTFEEYRRALERAKAEPENEEPDNDGPSSMLNPWRVRRAADYLDATRLPDGRWAYLARETGRWYRLDAVDMARLAWYLDYAHPAVRRDAYSLWCADTPAEEMPEGWAPTAE